MRSLVTLKEVPRHHRRNPRPRFTLENLHLPALTQASSLGVLADFDPLPLRQLGWDRLRTWRPWAAGTRDRIYAVGMVVKRLLLSLI